MNAFVIERDKLAANVREVMRRTGDKVLYAVVKGDGYGFGLAEYVRLLLDCGVAAFAVTEPEEAAAIRAAGAREEEILMLRSTALEEEIRELIRVNAVLTIGSSKAAVAANGIAGKLGGGPAKVHVKVDTGMGRYGFSPHETDEIESVFAYMENLQVCGLYTHLNCAFSSKKKTRAQIDTLTRVENRLRDAGYDPGRVHFANSSALFRFGDWELRDAVRIGSALTGRLAFPMKHSGLQKVGYLESRVCEVRWLQPGATVGYGGAYRARHATRIAVAPLGYSHGFAVEKIRDTYRLRDGIRFVLQDIKRTLMRERVTVTVGGKARPGTGACGYAPHSAGCDSHRMRRGRSGDGQRQPPVCGRARGA